MFKIKRPVRTGRTEFTYALGQTVKGYSHFSKQFGGSNIVELYIHSYHITQQLHSNVYTPQK